MQLALWNEPPEPAEESGFHPLPRLRGAAAPQHRTSSAPRAPSSGVPRTGPGRAALARPEPELERLKAKASGYIEQARADNTRRAYAHDWCAFQGWCAAHGQTPLPAEPQVLALYLTHLADTGRKPSTIRRARIAIGLEHALRGAARPDQHAGIRQLERGIGRTLGSRADPTNRSAKAFEFGPPFGTRGVVEWARGALPGSTLSRFPRAPHRTRRAPFVTHRALHRC